MKIPTTSKIALFAIALMTTINPAKAATQTPSGTLNTSSSTSSSVSAKIRKGSKCNVNEHCQYGWYCLDGAADNGKTNLQGTCVPNIVSKHLCHLTKMLSARIGRIIALFGVLFLGLSILQAKFDWKAVVTTAIGMILILAPFSFLALFTKDMRTACDFILSTEELERLIVQ